MAACKYTIKQSDGTTREFDDIDKLKDHLLSGDVNPEYIKSLLKNNQDATTKGQGPFEESGTKTSIEEYQGAGTPRNEKKIDETDSGHSGSDGSWPKEEEKEVKENPVIGNKNASVYEQRLNRGMHQILKSAKRAWGPMWEGVKRAVISGTANPRSYVEQMHQRIVGNKERLLVDDYGNVLLLMDRIDLTSRRINAIDDLNKANATGNDFIIANAQRRLADIESKLEQNDQLSDKAGTILGQSLAARRMMAALDYSLASMTRRLVNIYNGPVPPEVQARLRNIEKAHDEAMQKLADYEEEWKKKQAENQYGNQIKTKQAPGSGSKFKRTGKDLADKIRSLIPPDKGEAEKVQYNRGPAMTLAAEVIEKGGNIDDAIKKAVDYVKENGGFESDQDEEDFVSLLKSAESVPLKEVYLKRIKDIVTKTDGSGITKEMIRPIRDLINQYAREGETDFNTALEHVHQDLSSSFQDLKLEDLRDAYSGYGAVHIETETEIKNLIGKWKKEAKTWAQMGDILKEKSPYRRQSSTKQIKFDKTKAALERHMREMGIDWEDAPKNEDEKNERALESLKNRLQTQIDQLNYALSHEGGAEEYMQRNSKTPIPIDDAAKFLKDHRDELLDLVRGVANKENAKTLKNKDKIQRAQESIEKRIASLEKDINDINANVYKGKSKMNPITTPQLEMLRTRRDELRHLKDKLVTDYDPSSNMSAIALQKYKDMLLNKIMEYRRKIRERDFEPQNNKPSFLNDAEAKKLQLLVKRHEASFWLEKGKAEEANKSRLRKITDTVNAYRRFALLTGIPTLGELTIASIGRHVVNPVEEVMGAALSMLPGISTVSRQAPREGGGFNLKAERAALYEWAKADSYKDFLRVLKTGHGELDYRFGTHIVQNHTLLNVMGHIHGSLKNFSKRAEFARSYEKRMTYAIEQKGADPADELTQLTAMSGAYEDANRAIFLNNNLIVDNYNRMVNSLENYHNEKGIAFYDSIVHLGGALARYMIPIIKIPTNYVKETINYSPIGTIRGYGELITRAITGKLNDMSPDAADSLMRSLKKGTVGAGMFALGFYCPSAAGGYYHKGKKVDDESLDWDELSFFGLFTMPRWATHLPILEAIQLGATARRAYEAAIQKDENKGIDVDKGAAIWDGIVGSATGLTEKAPLMDLPQQIIQAQESGRNIATFASREMEGLVPLVVQQGAQYLDKDENGRVIKRDPQGFLEQMETGIPGLRSTVPTKEERQEANQ